MSKLAKYLNQHILGNVFDRPSICQAYATDRSVLEINPRFVAIPETTEDVCKLVRFSNQLALRGFELPITVRGSGTDKTGAAIGEGVVISTSRLNHVEEIDTRGRLVRVQAGVTLGTLNTALSLHGLCLPVDYDPAATIGGLIANCPSDDASSQYGGIFHYVERAEVVLASGDRIQLAPYSHRTIETKNLSDSAEGALYRKIQEVVDRHGDAIADRSMRSFDTAGYANITRVRDSHSFNLLPLMFASQGTLGIITDVILHVEPLPPATRQFAVPLHDLKALLRFTNFVRELDPRTVRIYDLRIIRAAAAYGNQPTLLSLHELGDGWLVLVEFDDRKRRAERKIQNCIEVLPVGSIAIAETPDNSLEFREFRTAVLSYLNDNLSGERLPIIDDVYIPSYKLTDFIDDLKMIEQTLDLELPVFGSFVTSNYHVRPEIDCTTVAGRKQMIAFLRQYGRLVQSVGGSVTGGSPEGRVKALVTPKFSTEEQGLYSAIKDAFDPNHILNPGVKLSVDPTTVIRHLRNAEPEGVIYL